MLGSITIIRSYNFTAKAIHFGMWLWAILRNSKPAKCYNHCEFRWDNMTSGAISEGVKNREWLPYWKHFKKAEKIDYWINFTNEEWDRVIKYVRESKDTPYEFVMFWHHFLYILTNEWKGDNTDKKLFCLEYVIRILNVSCKFDYINPYMNPYEFKIWADKNLK